MNWTKGINHQLGSISRCDPIAFSPARYTEAARHSTRSEFAKCLGDGHGFGTSRCPPLGRNSDGNLRELQIAKERSRNKLWQGHVGSMLFQSRPINPKPPSLESPKQGRYGFR